MTRRRVDYPSGTRDRRRVAPSSRGSTALPGAAEAHEPQRSIQQPVFFPTIGFLPKPSHRFHLRGGANLDQGDAAGQFGEAVPLRQLDRQFVTIKSGANDLFLLQAGCRSAANPPTCVLQAFNGSLATL